MYKNLGIEADKEIVTYCWMGLRASHAYAILRLLGYIRMFASMMPHGQNGEKSALSPLRGDTMEITEDWKLARVIVLFPETMSVLYEIGFTDFESPVMRHAAKLVTVKEAGGLTGTDVTSLIENLNKCIQGSD